MASGEDELIARLFAPLAGPAGLGLRDDAALMSVPPGRELVLTKDAVVAGVHFFPDDPPDTIARKALGVNLSDLAAKAARPAGFLMALALPTGWTQAWLAAFVNGLGDEASRWNCPLIGGDTVATPGPLVVTVTALGLVESGRMLLRTGARAGDLIYVSGTVGDGALGLLVRQAERGGQGAPWLEAAGADTRAALRGRYLVPEPRLGLRPALAEANAGMDVSDGLVGDLAKMLRVSGVGGRIEAARVPLSRAAQEALALAPHLLHRVLTGGDDYEILATVPPERAAAFEGAAAAAGIAVTFIGEVLAAGGEGLVVRDGAGAPMIFQQGAYTHA